MVRTAHSGHHSFIQSPGVRANPRTHNSQEVTTVSSFVHNGNKFCLGAK